MPGLTFWNSLKRIIAWWGSFNPSHILPKLLLLPSRGTLRQWCKPETPYWCNIPVHVTGYTLFILQHGTQPSVLYFRLLTSQFKFPRTFPPFSLFLFFLACLGFYSLICYPPAFSSFFSASFNPLPLSLFHFPFLLPSSIPLIPSCIFPFFLSCFLYGPS